MRAAAILLAGIALQLLYWEVRLPVHICVRRVCKPLYITDPGALHLAVTCCMGKQSWCQLCGPPFVWLAGLFRERSCCNPKTVAVFAVPGQGLPVVTRLHSTVRLHVRA